MRIRSAVLLGSATLLLACAQQPTDYAPTYSSYTTEYATPAYPRYGYAPGYNGLDYYGSDVFIGSGGYWAGGNDRGPYPRHGWDRDRAWQEHQVLRHENEAQARAQAWQQLQRQKPFQAAQAQAALQQQQQMAAAQAARAQALQATNQQRAQFLATQNQALWQQRAAQQQALSAAQARRQRGLTQ